MSHPGAAAVSGLSVDAEMNPLSLPKDDAPAPGDRWDGRPPGSATPSAPPRSNGSNRRPGVSSGIDLGRLRGGGAADDRAGADDESGANGTSRSGPDRPRHRPRRRGRRGRERLITAAALAAVRCPRLRFESADTPERTQIGEGLVRFAVRAGRLETGGEAGRYFLQHADGCGVDGRASPRASRSCSTPTPARSAMSSTRRTRAGGGVGRGVNPGRRVRGRLARGRPPGAQSIPSQTAAIASSAAAVPATDSTNTSVRGGRTAFGRTRSPAASAAAAATSGRRGTRRGRAPAWCTSSQRGRRPVRGRRRPSRRAAPCRNRRRTPGPRRRGR